jgi:hypothetical protein
VLWVRTNEKNAATTNQQKDKLAEYPHHPELKSSKDPAMISTARKARTDAR